jgi:arabinan endo-1,5-alpha-L-arabinosidase
LSGTLVAKGDANWAGVDHNSAYTLDGKSIIVMHGYDKRDNGRSKLIIREMKRDRGDWPSIVLSPELTQETVPKTATEVKAAH